ncbi:chemotaxis protein CheW [Muricoccus pecuniae]|uniref:Purine-binding chemotaxis protein CheW n=1 Tax=Muricoccus pecuniae TaxID=693023 RepID=A0A840Y6X3_9PROT|nr:chemotaxis protein CheW [Roseomonas pecuniae]MBB5695630.1 purine-binding chemotaxis protein CheW [Roseomonas pecuniae]
MNAPMNIEAVAGTLKAPADGAGMATGQYITCALNDAEYGIDIMSVREIKGWTETTAIPNAPSWIRGVINLRGVIVPILDLRARFGMAPTMPGPMHVVVIIQTMERTVGLLVDAVSDIITVDVSDIRPVPEIGAGGPDRLLSGLVPLERGMVALVALEKLLNITEDSALKSERPREDTAALAA